MGRRGEHSPQEIQAMAVAAAARIVAEQGLAGLSARKVAGEIGYTVGMLYVAFANLDELILAVNAITLDDMHLCLRRSLRNCRTPASCIHAMARAYLRFAEDNRLRWLAVFEHRLPEGSDRPDWYADKVARLFALVETRLRELAARDIGDKAVALAATALWSSVHGIAILALSGKLVVRSGHGLDRLVESLVSNYLAGFTQR